MENLNLNNCYKFSTNVKDHIEMDMGWIVSEWRKLRRTIPEPGLDSISKFMFLTRLSKKWEPKCELGISSHLELKNQEQNLYFIPFIS